jgi:hypothetical protein
MTKIGYLFPNLNSNALRHLRNIFMIDELNMIIFIDETNKNIIDNIYFKENNIKNKDIFFYNVNNLLKKINELDIILTCFNPDISIIFDKKNIFNIKNIKPQIIYIHHGLIELFITKDSIQEDNEFIKEWNNKVSYLNKFNIKFITCCNNLYNLMSNLKLNKKNLYKINSLPQFDLNKNIYKNFNKYINSILIVISESNNIDFNNIYKIINILRKNYPLKEIILKFKVYKKKYKTYFENISNNYDNIKLFYHEKYLFEFINSYFIIITSGGTSFLESLMFNKKVILYQDNNKKSTFSSYTFKLNKLLIINDLNHLENKIKLIENDKYFDDEYTNEIDYIKKFHINSVINNFKIEFKNIIQNL